MERGEFNVGFPEDLVEKRTSLGDVESTEVQGEVACKTLPDELVERIMAMVPFPAIFKARCLSKLWLARLSCIGTQTLPWTDESVLPDVRSLFESNGLSSISSDDDDASEFSAISTFQRQVSERSGSWDTFCSLSKSPSGGYFGYDGTSQTWRRMPSLSFLPRLRESSGSDLQMEGPLLCLFRGGQRGDISTYEVREIYVANVLTQSWMQLPPQTARERRPSVLYRKLVVDKSSDTYMVILLCSCYEENVIAVHVYDSKSESWTSNSFDQNSFSQYPETAALLNGVLYMGGFSSNSHNSFDFMAYNLENQTLEHVPLSLPTCFNTPYDIKTVGLLVYNSNLLMVVTLKWSPENRPTRPESRRPGAISFWNPEDLFNGIHDKTQLVLRIDPQLGTSWQLAEGPPGDLGMGKLGMGFLGNGGTHSLVDGNCIVFGKEEEEGGRVLQYNCEANQWSYFQAPKGYKWLASCFRPGVNPFMTV